MKGISNSTFGKKSNPIIEMKGISNSTFGKKENQVLVKDIP
jgi:hypothetical protein